MSEENIESIKAFYKDCDKFLRDITIEWIKEDGTISGIFNGDELLEYKELKPSCNKPLFSNEDEIALSKYRYKNLLSNTDSEQIGFFDKRVYTTMRPYTLYSKNSSYEYNRFTPLVGLQKQYNNSAVANVYANQMCYIDNLTNEYYKSNNILLTIICMILNTIDYKFYKYVNNGNEQCKAESFIVNDHNIFSGFDLPNLTELTFKIIPNHKSLQIKFKSNIIYNMTILKHKLNESDTDIFNCYYNINGKQIKFNLIDYCNSKLMLFNNYYYNWGCKLEQKLFYINQPIINHPYGQRVFYNVIYSLENKLINPVSEISKEISKNQEFINNQNYNNQLLQKNQEIKELKINEIQDNLINSLTKTLQEFKEKYENQLKIHQEEFEKIKSEYVENYNNSLIEFNKIIKEKDHELEELTKENELNKNLIMTFKDKLITLLNYCINNSIYWNISDLFDKFINDYTELTKENKLIKNKLEELTKENELNKNKLKEVHNNITIFKQKLIEEFPYN